MVRVHREVVHRCLNTDISEEKDDTRPVSASTTPCMTSLHAYFHNRDQAAFQRQLSTSILTDVNARDWLGRTVLHLACTASARPATEYVRMLLAHRAIDVNLQDAESHWTALHRALYNGNIASAYVITFPHDISQLTASKHPSVAKRRCRYLVKGLRGVSGL